MPKYQHKQQSAPYKTSKQKGAWAEDIACKWLVNQGLTVKQKNFYTRYGEIDLVMNDSSQLIFVEIKFRKNNDFGNNQPMRFDAVTVSPPLDKHLDCTINWIKNILS